MGPAAKPKQPEVLSEQYELVEGPELMQGDIFEDCPVFFPPKDLEFPIDSNKEYEFTMGTDNLIILSQSCDLVVSQKPDMWQVLLCPVWPVSEAAKKSSFLASSKGKEECRRGNMTGYHMLHACEHDAWKQGPSIVSFRDISSLPLDFMREMAKGRKKRPRLRPPYREHLAQAFARYFMRVGLPVDIPPFR